MLSYDVVDEFFLCLLLCYPTYNFNIDNKNDFICFSASHVRFTYFTMLFWNNLMSFIWIDNKKIPQDNYIPTEQYIRHIRWL